MRYTLKVFLALLLGLSLLLLAVSCSGGERGAEEKVQVRLALDWYPNANHIGLYVAQEKGYFAEEGLEVTMYTPVDPSTILQTVGAGQDDFGISYQPDVLLARGQGVPVVSVAALVQRPLNSVMALQASGITRPRELVGKRVGYPGIPTNEALLDTMLKADGAGGLEDVDLVNVGFDLVPALIGRRVDAIVGAYLTHESIMAENQGYPVTIIKPEDWGVPSFYELVVVASEGTLRDRPEVAQRFVRALVRGYGDAASDPAAGLEVLLRAGGGEIDEAIERPGTKILAPLWTEGVEVFGWQTAERWEAFATWMKENGLLDSKVDPGDAFTNRFVEATAR